MNLKRAYWSVAESADQTLLSGGRITIDQWVQVLNGLRTEYSELVIGNNYVSGFFWYMGGGCGGWPASPELQLAIKRKEPIAIGHHYLVVHIHLAESFDIDLPGKKQWTVELLANHVTAFNFRNEQTNYSRSNRHPGHPGRFCEGLRFPRRRTRFDTPDKLGQIPFFECIVDVDYDRYYLRSIPRISGRKIAEQMEIMRAFQWAHSHLPPTKRDIDFQFIYNKVLDYAVQYLNEGTRWAHETWTAMERPNGD